MRNCKRVLSAPFPILSGGRQPTTLGEKIKYRRIQRNLFQRELAVLLGVEKASIENWEQDRAAPNLRAWPALLKFLGDDPRPSATTIGERLRRHRQCLGMSSYEAAEAMAVDPATAQKWERQPDDRHDHRSIPIVTRFLGVNPLPTPEKVGAYIRQVRHLAGLSQRELGRCLGLCADVISRWEVGKAVPRPEQLSDVEAISLSQEPPLGLNCPDPVKDLCVNAPRPDTRFKPRSEYPTQLATLGDHIRQRRIDLGLSQAAVVKMFGVNRNALCNWERSTQEPSVEFMPMIIEFLGYNPLPKDGSLAEQIRSARRSLGLTQLKLGRRLGVSRETVNYWENGQRTPPKEIVEKGLSGYFRSKSGESTVENGR